MQDFLTMLVLFGGGFILSVYLIVTGWREGESGLNNFTLGIVFLFVVWVPSFGFLLVWMLR
jgi:hypothetical protein